jgi:hypothetical protein
LLGALFALGRRRLSFCSPACFIRWTVSESTLAVHAQRKGALPAGLSGILGDVFSMACSWNTTVALCDDFKVKLSYSAANAPNKCLVNSTEFSKVQSIKDKHGNLNVSLINAWLAVLGVPQVVHASLHLCSRAAKTTGSAMAADMWHIQRVAIWLVSQLAQPMPKR